MAAVTELLERAEHTGHAGSHSHDHDHQGKSNNRGKLIGLTMGLIGVLVALCAALVGGERNEMSRAMIEQTQATADATSASTKYRVVLIAIEQMRAQPDIPAQTRERFVRLYDDYSKERQFTATWASSYQPLIDAHFDGAEGFEHAQLIAEIGIVIASLAVLLASTPAWIVSLVLAVGSVGMVGYTWVQTHATVSKYEHIVEHSQEQYKALRAAHTGDHSDSDAVNALDPDGAIRKAIAAQLQAVEKHTETETPTKPEQHGK